MVVSADHSEVVAVHVIDEVEVGEADFLGVDAEGVGAVVLSLEADGHFAHLGGVDDSVVLAFLRDEHLGVVLVELELGQLVASVETHDGAVDGGAMAVAKVLSFFLVVPNHLKF